MKIIVFGANGRVGQLVVAELLKRGHHVRAFVHGNAPFQTSNQLEIVQGDIYDAASVKNAIVGAEAVMSTLGSWGTPKKDILTQGMHNIIPAMRAAKLQKIVSLTGADCNVSGDPMGIVHNLSHALFSVLAGKILKDGENHLDQLADSGLDWSVLRSPVMNDKGEPEKFAITIQKRPGPWKTINRRSVALAMVDVLETNTFNQQAPFITRS